MATDELVYLSAIELRSRYRRRELSPLEVTEAILENIESGRKADISVSQLLNIARGLNVPVSMLLAPVGTPDSVLDLPNLSEDFESMTAAEFDCWLSSTPASAYRPRSASERSDIAVLSSLRELGTLRRELDRLEIVLQSQKAAADPDLVAANLEVEQRIDRIAKEAASVANLLQTAGLELAQSEVEPSEPESL